LSPGSASESYSVKKLIKQFPTKGWKKTTLNDFIKQLRDTGLAEHKAGSSWPRKMHTDENINLVNELVLSQKYASLSHDTCRKIARETGLHRVRKKGATLFSAITLPNPNRSSKFFYHHTQQ